jgi:small subunit ribosomal protein S6
MADKVVKVNSYEAMFLFGPAGADGEKAIAISRGIVEKHGGTISVIKKWDERKLAYEIGKNKRGTYVIAFFTASGPAITALERDVKLSEEVLRVLVTRADHLNEKEMAAVEPQPIAPPPERNPWDRPDFNMGGGGRGGYDRAPREDRGDRPRPARREETADAGAGKE